jgi:RNA-directed DNA polymerase
MNAYKRVMKNSGAAGTDGMTCEQLMEHVKKKWAVIKVSLLEGTYEPNLVRRVEIPKPNGGVRQLGIPTAVDRLIQQALHQVLEPNPYLTPVSRSIVSNSERTEEREKQYKHNGC